MKGRFHMNDLREEYLTVKAMLERYTPYTHGVERALDLLERQQNEITDLKMQLSNYKFDLNNARY
jgi:hypothetical protein